jgi:ligand-binding sensor domain-containing protein
MAVINEVVPTGDVIWAATEGGVLRYDRSEGSYTRFTRVDGLAGNQVLSAVADSEGNLWFGTGADGLSKFNVSSNRFTDPFSQFRELELNDLAVDGDHLYIASNLGISLFLTDVERVKENYRQFGSLPRDAAVKAVAVHAGKLWAGTENGLAWADTTAPNLQDPLAWFSDDSVGDVGDLLVSGDTLFAAAGESVWFFDPTQESWIFERRLGKITSLGLYEGKIAALTVDSHFFHRLTPGSWASIPSSGESRTLSRHGDALWVGTVDGLFVLGETLPPPLGDPPANHFYEMTLSAEGNLWVASIPNDQTVPTEGVLHFDRKRWSVHDMTTGMPSDLTVAVATDEFDQLWAGTWAHGLAVLDAGGRWQHLNQANSVLRGITEPDAPSFVVVSHIERDRQGNMWLANIQAGLAVMDGYPPTQSFLNTQEALGLAPGRNIGKFAMGPDDLKWVGTAQDGLIMFDDGGTPFEEGDGRAVVINSGFDSRLGSDFVTAVYSN